jgi:hypothetical protein
MAGKKSIVILYTYLVFAILSTTGCTHTMQMSKCKEMFSEFYVDPVVARQNVPQSYKVRIYPNGKALLLVLVQDCEKCVLKGFIPISPMKMSHIWIELEGPEEVGLALPGTKGSLPTSYWYGLPHQTDSTLAHIAFWLVGIDTQLVKEITMGGDPGRTRQGSVVENDPGSGYHWTETSQLWPMPNLVTGRRWFYRQYGRLVKRQSEGIVVCRANFIGEGKVVLEAEPGSAIEKLHFGTTLQGSTKAVEINCQVKIQVGVHNSVSD